MIEPRKVRRAVSLAKTKSLNMRPTNLSPLGSASFLIITGTASSGIILETPTPKISSMFLAALPSYVKPRATRPARLTRELAMTMCGIVI